MRDLTFHKHEYEEMSEGVRILLKTVVDKLPDPQRRKYRQLKWEGEVARKEAELVRDGIDAALLSEWLNNNVSQTDQGRQPSVVYKLLAQVQMLGHDAGMDRLNAALAANIHTGRPQTCTPQYLKAILRNTTAARPVAPPSPPSGAPATRADAWERMLSILRQRIDADNYRTWIAPLALKSIEQHQVQIWCPDDVCKEWLHGHYAQVMADAYCRVFGSGPASVAFCVEEEGE